MNTISKYLSLVKFSHTIFAMPFAMIGFTYGAVGVDNGESPWWWARLLFLVILCMVCARNVAMGFNRWADRKIDAKNPRTADREIPSGVVTNGGAITFIICNAALFIVAALLINNLTAMLSPVALFVVMAYSYCKRFTSLVHLVLGLALAIAPVGAYISVTGNFAVEPCILALLVLTWCGGFDIIYALQDADFDRAENLHSIPARFSATTALIISAGLHVVSAVALLWFTTYCPQSPILWCGVVIFITLLIMQHVLVTPTKQKNIGIAFGTLNGVASAVLAVAIITDLLIFG